VTRVSFKTRLAGPSGPAEIRTGLGDKGTLIEAASLSLSTPSAIDEKKPLTRLATLATLSPQERAENYRR